MLDITNYGPLTREQRLDIFNQALHTVPFFTKLDFPLTVGTTKLNQFNSKIPINNDFLITEMQGNFGEVFTDTGTLFNLSVWTGNQQSLYGYQAQQLLPTGVLATDARFQTPIANQVFDDRQWEYQPILVKRNDFVYAQIGNVAPKTSEGNAILCLKGFNLLPNAYLTNGETEKINDSLDTDTRFEYFRVTIDQQGFSIYTLSNDRFPRLILGFGAKNSTDVKANVSDITVFIKDASRRLTLMNEPLPIDFLAPRLTCLLDQYIYYFPVAYYLQPFAQLQFQVTNTSPNTPEGCDLAVLTRTV